MARKEKKDDGGGGGWMATYGDMVTLLLCFFVLLYAMSSMDESKWELIVLSVNPDAQSTSQIVLVKDSSEEEFDEEMEFEGGVHGSNPSSSDDETAEESTLNEDEVSAAASAEVVMEIDASNELFEALKEYIEQNELQDDVQLAEGDGFTFITFLNNIFFAGNESEIRPEGKAMLDFIGQIAGDLNPHIREVHVLGHTSQAEPNVPNNPETDRFLSSDRASEVATYLHVNSSIDAFKIIATGYGQHRPISSFDTRESRAKNRRVEIIVTEHSDVTDQLNDYYRDVYGVIVEY